MKKEKTVEDYKKEIKEMIDKFPEYGENRVLEFTMEKIAFLESIYIGFGKNSKFSEEFKNSAERESKELSKFVNAFSQLTKNNV